MKCALDLVTIATAERIRQREELTKSSIEWCEENIGKYLEYRAETGREIIYKGDFLSTDKLGLYHEMKVRKAGGANTLWEIGTAEPLDLQTIIKHLESHCFETELIDKTFYMYGHGYEIIVTPSAKCLLPS